MTLTIPSTGRNSDQALLQSTITTLAAVPSTSPAYQAAQQRLAQAQREIVLSLIDRGALQAATLLSTAAVFASGAVPPNSVLPILGQISTLNSNITTWSSSNPALVSQAQTQLEALRRQAVVELLASGVMSAALVLSTQSFAGAN
jgi:hypothetical protein